MIMRSDDEDSRKAVMRIASPLVRKKMQDLRQTVKTIQAKVEQEPDEAYEQVTKLDAKCLIQLLQRMQDRNEEDLVAKLLTAIANCASVKENQVRKEIFRFGVYAMCSQDRLFEVGSIDVLHDLIKGSDSDMVRAIAVQAVGNLASNSEKSFLVKVS